MKKFNKFVPLKHVLKQVYNFSDKYKFHIISIVLASMIINNVNFSADPCEDFFEFSCGNFLHKTRLEDNQIGLNTFQTIDKQLGESLSGIIYLYFY